MSQIEQLIGEHLAKHDVQKLPSGFRFNRTHGATDLTFTPANNFRDDFKLSSIATVRTRFTKGIPPFTSNELNRLNRRAVFGNFMSGESGIELQLTFSIYENEPAFDWVIEILLKAFGEQLALGLGIAQSDATEELLRFNRSNLEYPRAWKNQPAREAFVKSAEAFCKRGLVSTAEQNGLTLEVPLTPGPASRMLDPNAETALIRISTDVPHPVAGVGYLCTIALPYDPPKNEISSWCEHLNSVEHAQADFVPRMGAWAIRGLDDEIVYSLFWPTTGETDQHANLANWMVQRTLWAREQFWEPKKGLFRNGAQK